MKKHTVTSVRNRYVVIIVAVRIYPHSGKRVVVFPEFILQKIIIFVKSLLYGKQILFSAKRKLKVVVGAIIGQNITVYNTLCRVDVPLVVSADNSELK